MSDNMNVAWLSIIPALIGIWHGWFVSLPPELTAGIGTLLGYLGGMWSVHFSWSGRVDT